MPRRLTVRAQHRLLCVDAASQLGPRRFQQRRMPARTSIASHYRTTDRKRFLGCDQDQLGPVGSCMTLHSGGVSSMPMEACSLWKARRANDQRSAPCHGGSGVHPCLGCTCCSVGWQRFGHVRWSRCRADMCGTRCRCNETSGSDPIGGTDMPVKSRHKRGRFFHGNQGSGFCGRRRSLAGLLRAHLQTDW